MTTCPACAEARIRESHLFHAGCKGCAARAVSRGPNFHRCRDAGRQDRAYQGELRQLGVTHEEVRAHRMDALNRKETTCAAPSAIAP